MHFNFAKKVELSLVFLLFKYRYMFVCIDRHTYIDTQTEHMHYG